jgi:hypothetical protein
MNTMSEQISGDNKKPSGRDAKRLRNAIARRKIQRLRETQALREWLTDVWDELPGVHQLQTVRRYYKRS